MQQVFKILEHLPYLQRHIFEHKSGTTQQWFIDLTVLYHYANQINSACWVIFYAFFCHLLTFFKIYFFKKNFQKHYQSVKQV